MMGGLAVLSGEDIAPLGRYRSLPDRGVKRSSHEPCSLSGLL